MAYPPPSFRQRIPDRPTDGGAFASDDRAHRGLDGVGDPAHVVMMPRAAPQPYRRRALELLAASPDGYTEALMLAHGFPVPLLVTLAFGHHEDRTPTHGYAPSREAAMAAFAKSCRRK